MHHLCKNALVKNGLEILNGRIVGDDLERGLTEDLLTGLEGGDQDPEERENHDGQEQNDYDRGDYFD